MANSKLFLLQSITALLLILILDAIWFMLNGKMYNDAITTIQGTSIKINLYGAISAYICILLSLMLIVFPSISQDKTTTNKLLLSLKHGAVFGFLAYGIYNATNLATLKSYPVSVAITDTFWGGFVFFVSVSITQYIFRL